MSTPFENAPRMGQKFEQAGNNTQPEELNFDPPRKVWDKDRTLAPTPSGTIDAEIVQELDHTAQRAIQQAQREPDEFEQRMRQRFEHARPLNRGPRK